MSKTTAVVKLEAKTAGLYGMTFLRFGADYNDERNKAWAKFTPAMTISMTVLDSAAEPFEYGGRYLLTFEHAE